MRRWEVEAAKAHLDHNADIKTVEAILTQLLRVYRVSGDIAEEELGEEAGLKESNGLQSTCILNSLF